MKETGKSMLDQHSESGVSPNSGWLLWRPLANLLVGLFIGILLGVAGYHLLQGNLYKILNVLIFASYVAFCALIFSFIAAFVFWKYISQVILGPNSDNARALIRDTQRVSNIVTDRIILRVLDDAPEDIKQGVRFMLPRLANIFFWGRIRNWWWQWILGIFVAIGGLTGSILLMNQNELLNNQNALIQRQMSLEEASRRSTLITLMSNIMDKVDREIEKQRELLPLKNRDSARFQLSQSLIGQIAALSHSFKPYRYMDGDTMLSRPLSPERGQLLLTLYLLPLDTFTMSNIMRSSTFYCADLKDAILNDANLSNANLIWANLNGANLNGSNLNNANLSSAEMKGANLIRANMSNVGLNGSDLSNSSLGGANLSGASLWKVNLSNASLEYANLSGAELFEANLSGAELTKTNLSEAKMSNANLSRSNLRACLGI